MRRRRKRRKLFVSAVSYRPLTFRPIPDLDIPALPPAHISFGQDGSAKASSSSSVLPTGPKKHGKGKERAAELELDNRPYERELSKREKAAVS